MGWNSCSTVWNLYSIGWNINLYEERPHDPACMLPEDVGIKRREV
jgi:hypothetical protein